MMTTPSQESSEFTCFLCHKTFGKLWSDAEAKAEMQTRPPELSEGDLGVICNDCFSPFMQWFEKRDAAEAKGAQAEG